MTSERMDQCTQTNSHYRPVGLRNDLLFFVGPETVTCDLMWSQHRNHMVNDFDDLAGRVVLLFPTFQLLLQERRSHDVGEAS